MLPYEYEYRLGSVHEHDSRRFAAPSAVTSCCQRTMADIILVLASHIVTWPTPAMEPNSLEDARDRQNVSVDVGPKGFGPGSACPRALRLGRCTAYSYILSYNLYTQGFRAGSRSRRCWFRAEAPTIQDRRQKPPHVSSRVLSTAQST